MLQKLPAATLNDRCKQKQGNAEVGKQAESGQVSLNRSNPAVSVEIATADSEGVGVSFVGSHDLIRKSPMPGAWGLLI